MKIPKKFESSHLMSFEKQTEKMIFLKEQKQVL
jgi:hypothetical protein